MVADKTRRQYTAEFKRESVELLLRSEKTARAISDDLGIRSDLLGKWKSQYLAAKENAFPGTGYLQDPEQEQIRKLERELRHITEARDILKKVVSIFSKDPK